jgi:glycosyltransferase involved in cell wall biosynthesis
LRAVSAVCVDNGEELTRESLESIRGQVDELIVVAGPRSNLELLRELADTVIGPLGPVGYARYIGLTRASGDLVVLCDTDTIYMDGHVEHAIDDFKRFPWLAVVKAGSVEPHKPSLLGYLESAVARVIGAFEYGWVVDRRKLLSAMMARDVEALKNPRTDIGLVSYKLLLKSLVDHRMRVRTRLPSYYFESYFASAVGSVIPIAGVSAMVLIGCVGGQVKKLLSWREE